MQACRAGQVHPAAGGPSMGDERRRPPFPDALGAMDDDAALQALAEGAPDAMAVLYDRHGAAAYRTAMVLLREPGTAEEVVQESFLAVWRNRGRFDPGRGSFRPWLLTIVRNRARDRMRANRVRPESTVDGWDMPGDAADAVDVWEEVSVEAERERVRRALATLPQDMRRIFGLAYYGGMSQSEISAQLEMPLGTVKSTMRRGLQRLRGLLLESGGAEALP
ncbi:MAG TPA: sigma-70 family RNA polymerase sigma factor [Candidatus Dormibacteraeota bacterium]|nr:sigma-70 family RNA polymerase sigma factor [Candidatus Dormibacteraeota bacterium]